MDDRRPNIAGEPLEDERPEAAGGGSGQQRRLDELRARTLRNREPPPAPPEGEPAPEREDRTGSDDGRTDARKQTGA